MGAYHNRDAGDIHDQKRKKWEQEAKRHPEADGKPNQEMMKKAHHERRRARLSRIQAREFARQALQTLASRPQQTAQNAAAPKMSNGQPIDIQSLQRVAEVPIAEEEEDDSADVATTAAGFQSDSADSLGLPVQPLNATGDNVTTAAIGAAAKPSSLNGTPRGVVYGAGNSQFGASRDLASIRNPVGLENESQSGSDLKAQSTDTINPNDHIVTTADGVKDEETLEANRARVLKQMGLRRPASVEETGPIRAKTEDIFAVVHTHYKTLLETGVFYQGDESLPPTPGPSRNPPKFMKGF